MNARYFVSPYGTTFAVLEPYQAAIARDQDSVRILGSDNLGEQSPTVREYNVSRDFVDRSTEVTAEEARRQYPALVAYVGPEPTADYEATIAVIHADPHIVAFGAESTLQDRIQTGAVADLLRDYEIVIRKRLRAHALAE